MSAIGQAYKAAQLQNMLRSAINDKGVTVHTTATAKGITVGVTYEGSEEYQARFDRPRHTNFFPADKRAVQDLYTAARGPADHWIDIQAQLDDDIQAGRA